jgi:GAF domain-containing protein
LSASPSIASFPIAAPLIDGVDGNDAPLSELVTANRQRDALFRLSEHLARASTLEAIHAAALTAIEAALDCDRSSILLFDENHRMQFVAWHGLSEAYRTAVSGHTPWKRGQLDATPQTIADVEISDLEPMLKATILGEDIQAAAFIPLMSEAGVIGKFMAYFREPCAFTREDMAVALIIARQLTAAIERQRANAELAEELAATRTLQALSVEIAHEADLEGLYEKILDAAMLIMRSDLASLQDFHPHRGPQGELRLLTSRGFSDTAASLWKWVRAESECACGVAYRRMERVILHDVEIGDPPTRAIDLEGYRSTGIRAVQSTPLRARNGAMVGMLSTHWNRPHAPSVRDLRLLDILARLAADLIERKLQEEALARREERSRTLTQLLTDVPWQARSDGAFEDLQHAWENYTGQTWDSHAGHGWFEAVHPDDRNAMRASWSSACFHAEPFEHLARLWHAGSKQYRHCLFRATPLRNEDGLVREWVGACTEVEGSRDPAPL